MPYFKLKNITNTLGKRDNKVNTVQTIEFKDITGSKTISINPGSEIVIEASYLPVTAQKLRTDGVITVVEIDRNAYQKLLNAQDARIATQVQAPSQTEPTKVRDIEDKNKKSERKIK